VSYLAALAFAGFVQAGDLNSTLHWLQSSRLRPFFIKESTMKTPNTNTGGTAPLPSNQTGNLINNASALMQLLGGQKTTTSTNPGDISALQAVLGQLQGADYNAMLQSIFQQAAGSIPGIQTGMANAMGARSGSNSAVQAALSKILQQTTVAAQDQMAKQTLQNQQQQVQAGTSIAQATKGTQQTQQQGTNIGKGASTLAQATALLQLLGAGTKLAGAGTLPEAMGKFGAALGIPATTAMAPTTAAAPQASAVVTAPQMSMAPQAGGMNINALLAGSAAGAPAAPMPAVSNSGPQMSMADPSMFAPLLDINSIIGNTQPAPEMSMAPAEMFAPAFNINDFLGGGGASFTPDPGAYDFGSNWWE
jgi:hypothetical protein